MITTGWTIQHHDTVTSTQDIARQNLTAGTIIQATTQTGGKGRHGREWISQDGNLLFSFVINPNCEPSDYGQIALKTGLALGQAIQQCTTTKVMLKWPNDILVNTKKCAGILIEAEQGHLIIGIGINTKTAPPDAHALNIENNDTLRDAFFVHFDKLTPMTFETVKQNWLTMAHPVGTKMTVKIGNDIRSGQFQGLDQNSNLILDTQIITAGEIIL